MHGLVLFSNCSVLVMPGLVLFSNCSVRSSLGLYGYGVVKLCNVIVMALYG